MTQYRRCLKTFRGDNTPMCLDRYCMMCRPHVEVECARCRVACPGAFDGLKLCSPCRETPLGRQQYEDMQRARHEAWLAAGCPDPVEELKRHEPADH